MRPCWTSSASSRAPSTTGGKQASSQRTSRQESVGRVTLRLPLARTRERGSGGEGRTRLLACWSAGLLKHDAVLGEAARQRRRHRAIVLLNAVDQPLKVGLDQPRPPEHV